MKTSSPGHPRSLGATGPVGKGDLSSRSAGVVSGTQTRKYWSAVLPPGSGPRLKVTGFRA